MLNEDEYSNLQDWCTVLSLASTILCFLLLVLLLATPKQRLFPSRVTIYFTLCAFGFSFVILWGPMSGYRQIVDVFKLFPHPPSGNGSSLVHAQAEGGVQVERTLESLTALMSVGGTGIPKLPDPELETLCRIQGMFFQYFASALSIWFGLVFWTLYEVVCHLRTFQQFQKFEKYFLLAGFGLPAILTFIPSIFNPRGFGPELGVLWCWIAESESYWKFACLYSILSLLLLLSTFYLYRIVLTLRHVQAMSAASFSSALSDFIKRHILFVVICMIIWVQVVAWGINYWRFQDGDADIHYWFALTEIIAVCGLGTAVFFVYGCRVAHYRLVQRCCRALCCPVDPGDAKAPLLDSGTGEYTSQWDSDAVTNSTAESDYKVPEGGMVGRSLINDPNIQHYQGPAGGEAAEYRTPSNIPYVSPDNNGTFDVRDGLESSALDELRPVDGLDGYPAMMEPFNLAPDARVYDQRNAVRGGGYSPESDPNQLYVQYPSDNR